MLSEWTLFQERHHLTERIRNDHLWPKQSLAKNIYDFSHIPQQNWIIRLSLKKSITRWYTMYKVSGTSSMRKPSIEIINGGKSQFFFSVQVMQKRKMKIPMKLMSFQVNGIKKTIHSFQTFSSRLNAVRSFVHLHNKYMEVKEKSRSRSTKKMEKNMESINNA